MREGKEEVGEREWNHEILLYVPEGGEWTCLVKEGALIRPRPEFLQYDGHLELLLGCLQLFKCSRKRICFATKASRARRCTAL